MAVKTSVPESALEVLKRRIRKLMSESEARIFSLVELNDHFCAKKSNGKSPCKDGLLTEAISELLDDDILIATDAGYFLAKRKKEKEDEAHGAFPLLAGGHL